jgi:hypothetical protein
MSYPLAVRRRLARLTLLVLVSLAGAARAEIAPQAAQTAYVAGLEDVPLMRGLRPAGGNDVSFDSPQGRIVIVNTEGAVERANVLAFYADSMPALGWDRIGDSMFRREGELLRLEFGQRGDLLTVRFALSPVH